MTLDFDLNRALRGLIKLFWFFGQKRKAFLHFSRKKNGFKAFHLKLMHMGGVFDD